MHELKDVRYKTYLVEITANVKINILLFFYDSWIAYRKTKNTYVYVCLFVCRKDGALF